MIHSMPSTQIGGFSARSYLQKCILLAVVTSVLRNRSGASLIEVSDRELYEENCQYQPGFK